MIGIVGGGLTGLALAHELRKRGIEHTVFEGADRPGGVIRSGLVEGRLLEFGPQRGRMTPSPASLIAELGLEREVLYAPEDLRLYVHAAGTLREAPFSLGPLLMGNLLSWRGKLRLLAEPLTSRPRDEETVASLFLRKGGREAYERLAGPLFGGLYGSDPADMVVGLSMAPVLSALGVRRSILLSLLRSRGSMVPATAFSFRNGLQALTDALYERGPESIRLGTPARRLRREGSGWIVELEEGGVEAETVVLTCDAGSAASLLEGIAPEVAERLRRLVYNPIAVVHLLAPGTGLRGLGHQIALGGDLVTRGVTWNESLFQREGVFTAFLGGAGHRWVVDEPDDRLGEIAAREFTRVTGHFARVISVSRAAMPAWDTSWHVLEGIPVPPGIRIAANWRSRAGIPGRLAEAKSLAGELDRPNRVATPSGA